MSADSWTHTDVWWCHLVLTFEREQTQFELDSLVNRKPVKVVTRSRRNVVEHPKGRDTSVPKLFWDTLNTLTPRPRVTEVAMVTIVGRGSYRKSAMPSVPSVICHGRSICDTNVMAGSPNPIHLKFLSVCLITYSFYPLLKPANQLLTSAPRVVR